MTATPQDKAPGTAGYGSAAGGTASGGTPFSPTPGPSAGERARADATTASDEVRTAAQDADATVRNTAEELRSGAGKMVHDARERARQAAGDQKNMAAERVAGFADALRHASSDLDDQGQSFVSGVVRHAADGLADFSGAMRRNDLDDIVGSVESFARRQPALFIGSAVLAGFGIARFMKASSERRGGRGSDYGYAGTGVEDTGQRYGSSGPRMPYEGGV
jgi:hypothetical protein